LYLLSTIHHPSYAHTLLRTGRFASRRASYMWVTGFYARVTYIIELTLIDTAAGQSGENPIPRWPLPDLTFGEKLHALLPLAVSSLAYAS